MGMQKADMAIKMDRNGDHFLKDEFCYFDGKRKHCRGFVTLTASIYHSLLRKQIPLAVMEAESEDTKNIELFWTLLNEVFQKVSGQKDYKFNPVGWCTDMAGANFTAISKVFGNESAQRRYCKPIAVTVSRNFATSFSKVQLKWVILKQKLPLIISSKRVKTTLF